MVIGGYPNCIREVDYEASKVKYQRALLSGRCLGPLYSTADRIFTMEIDDRAAIDSVGGLSGSPVLGQTSNGTWVLAGMVIRGGDTNKRVHLLDVGVLLKAIESTAPKANGASA